MRELERQERQSRETENEDVKRKGHQINKHCRSTKRDEKFGDQEFKEEKKGIERI